MIKPKIEYLTQKEHAARLKVTPLTIYKIQRNSNLFKTIRVGERDKYIWVDGEPQFNNSSNTQADSKTIYNYLHKAVKTIIFDSLPPVQAGGKMRYNHTPYEVLSVTHVPSNEDNDAHYILEVVEVSSMIDPEVQRVIDTETDVEYLTLMEHAKRLSLPQTTIYSRQYHKNLYKTIHVGINIRYVWIKGKPQYNPIKEETNNE